MKKPLLFLFLLTAAFSGYGQKKARTIGLIVVPGITFSSEEPETAIRAASGVFYDHSFSRRFGINTGVQLGYERFERDHSNHHGYSNYEWPEKVVSRYLFIEVPVNLTFCLNPDSRSGFRTFLFSGILLNRIVGSKITQYYSNKVHVDRRLDYLHDLYGDSYMNLGVEVRKQVGEKYVLGLGTNAKFRPAYTFDVSSSMREPIIFNLNLKFGRNL